MKYKGISENTLKHILQSNETALLQKAVTEMVGTITSSADSLLSSFSIEKFFSNKNFSDLSDFVKNILDNVKSITEKAYTANVNTASLEKIMVGLTKDIKINTAKTSESVNKITSTNKPSNLNKDLETTNNDKVSFISTFRKTITDGLKNTFPLFEKMISGIKNADTDYTAEQRADEERGRSEKQSGLLTKTTDFLLSTLAPWLKDFDESKKLESNGFLSTFFPMLANFINASPLLLRILNWGKLILGIGGSIFGIWKFVEGIGKAVDVLGHEIDFTSLHGWFEALNLGLGNIVSSITGIDLKTVYNWLHNFDRTLASVYKRYLEPIIGGIWKSIKKMLQPFINKIQEGLNSLINDFVKKYPGLVEIIQNIYKYFTDDIVPFVKENYKWIMEGLVDTLKDVGNIAKRSLNVIVNPLGMGEDFELSFDTLVNAVVDMATTIETMWEFGQKMFDTFSQQNLTDFLTGHAWFELAKTAGTGISEAIEGYEKKREEKLAFVKEGSYGVEKLGLSREMEDLEKRKEYYGSVRSDITDKLESIIKEDKWGISYAKLSEMIAQLYESEDNAKIQSLSTILRTKLAPEDLNRLKAESGDDKEKFFEAVRNEMYDITDPYIKRYMERESKNISKKYEQYEHFDKLSKGESIEALKENSKLEDNAMKASSQAEAKIEEQKANQSSANINNSGNTNYNQQINNYTSTNKENDVSLDSAKLLEQSL